LILKRLAMAKERDIHVLILDLQLKQGTGFGVMVAPFSL